MISSMSICKKGLEEALKKNPNIKILDEYNVENSKDLGMSTAEDSLLSYDKIDAIVWPKR